MKFSNKFLQVAIVSLPFIWFYNSEKFKGMFLSSEVCAINLRNHSINNATENQSYVKSVENQMPTPRYQKRIFQSHYSYGIPTEKDFSSVGAIKPLFAAEDHESDFVKKAQEQQSSEPGSSAEKLIVFYGSFARTTWSSPFQWRRNGKFYFAESDSFTCPMKCAFTADRAFSNVSDAILFPFIDALMDTKASKTRFWKHIKDRPSNQIWIASTLEPPAYSANDATKLGKLNQMFNLTTHYRLDSDVYWPYGYFYKLGEEHVRTPANFQATLRLPLRNKKLAASLISNCHSTSGREVMISEMKKHIPIDTYGGCGENKCPFNDYCRDYLGLNYKFLLSFENSMCQDYITEKFYEAFRVGAVPVTMGLGDYSLVAPPNSYINAFDFPNVKALTDYLLFLDRNDEEYIKYFGWKSTYGLVSKIPVHVTFCRICMKVWETSGQKGPQEVEAFSKFYKHKMQPWTHPHQRKDTLAYWLLQNSTTACITIDEIRKNKYFD